jgi:hypothetical protein
VNPFFSDIKKFREALRSKADPGNCCWSCSSRDPRVVGFNAHKDFKSLGISTPGCEAMIGLCPTCAVAYMNSFNDSLAKRQGRPQPSSELTVEWYLAWMPPSLRMEAV